MYFQVGYISPDFFPWFANIKNKEIKIEIENKCECLTSQTSAFVHMVTLFYLFMRKYFIITGKVNHTFRLIKFSLVFM